MAWKDYYRVVEGGIAFVGIEALGWYATGNPTTALAIALPAAALIYRQGISIDTLETLVADAESILAGQTGSTNTKVIASTAGITLSLSDDNPSIGQAITFTVTGNKGSWTLYYGITTNPISLSQAQTSGSLDYALTAASPLGITLEAFSGSIPVFVKDAAGNMSNIITLTLSV